MLKHMVSNEAQLTMILGESNDPPAFGNELGQRLYGLCPPWIVHSHTLCKRSATNQTKHRH